MPVARWSNAWAALVLAGALLACGRAHGQGVGGEIDYTGSLGPIGDQRPLCLCLYTDAQLLNGIGCLIYRTNPVHWNLSGRGPGPFYMVAFVDLHINEQLDPDEPFEIYRDRAAPLGDPIGGQSGDMNVDFAFGDENVS